MEAARGDSNKASAAGASPPAVRLRPKAGLPAALRLQRAAGNRAVTGLLAVQRAGPGELHPGDNVRVDDDGVELRGTFVGEEGDKAIIDVTHVDGDATDDPAWKNSRYPLDRVHKAAAGNQLPPPHPRPAEGFRIAHFHKADGPTAAEFIAPHIKWDQIGAANRIDITQHGLGSGLYGVAKPSAEMIAEAAEKHESTPTYITLANPLYLQDAAHGQQLTELSKELQRVAERIRDTYKGLTHYGVGDWFKANPTVAQQLAAKTAKVLARVGAQPVQAEAIESALFDFFVSYHIKQLVAQPINFLLGSLGYDGIYAENPEDNNFTRGCVAFVLPQGTRQTTRHDRLAPSSGAE